MTAEHPSAKSQSAQSYDADFEIRRKLLEVAASRLVEASTLDDIIAITTSAARSIASADGVCFVLRDHNKCHYVNEDAIAPLWKGQRFPLEACVSGWSMLNNQTVAIEDVFADPRVPHDAYRRTFVKSLLMTPIRAAAPAAAIGAYWADHHCSTKNEIALIEELAGVVGQAMQLARAA